MVKVQKNIVFLYDICYNNPVSIQENKCKRSFCVW